MFAVVDRLLAYIYRLAAIYCLCDYRMWALSLLWCCRQDMSYGIGQATTVQVYAVHPENNTADIESTSVQNKKRKKNML